MSFDKPTRNLLAKMTAAARDRLAEDTAAQLQTSYGLYPDGSRLDVAQLPEDRHAAAELRALLDHFESAEPEGKQRKPNAYQRLVREIGFTLLNRLAALRLCEERGLVIECVRTGMNSAGFQLYDRLAGGALGNRYQTYRAFLACMFDELAADLGDLFDRSTPQSAVFPSEPALNDVLALLNDTELASRKIWQQDETIGWIYQYYNDPAERKKMRDESQAPRNSRELAVRNQFFTPRYVVEFLTDNTLGRTWYEMCQGQTKLTEQCRYLVQRRHPIFLAEGQEAPAPFDPATAASSDPDLPGEMWVRPNPELESISELFTYALTVGGYDYARQVLNIECGELANRRREQYAQTGKWEGSFEELRCCLFFEQRRYHHFGRGPEGEDAQAVINLHKAICEQWDREVDLVPFRAKKDPRRLRVLDPACGSGHFLLYAFDLLESIYSEAYDDPDMGADLQDAFPDRADFTHQVPRLILENNLHGIDIDPRAAQIAALALWLRAQRAWQSQKLGSAERPQIGRTHIVVAEPMPGDERLLEDFIADLPKDQHPEIIGPLVRTVFEKMKLAGEAGSLLKIEEELKEAIDQARTAWNRAPQPEQLSFLPGQPTPKQLGLDLSGITDESFWQQAEEFVLRAMERYARQAENGKGIRRRLFAGDATQGFAFIDLCRKRYDVVLMNPPFGLSPTGLYDYLNKEYPDTFIDLLGAFVERAKVLSPGGTVGAITSRACLYTKTLLDWRRKQISGKIQSLIDLGIGVLDDAMVRACAYVVPSTTQETPGVYINLRKTDEKGLCLSKAINLLSEGKPLDNMYICTPSLFLKIPQSRILYWLSDAFWGKVKSLPTFEPNVGTVRAGLTTYDDERFIRLRWEVNAEDIGKNKIWMLLSKGGYYGTFYADVHLVVKWFRTGSEVGEFNKILYSTDAQSRRGSKYYLRDVITYSRRTDYFSARILPSNVIFADKGPAIISESQVSPLYLGGIFNSDLFRALIHSQAQGGCFETGILKTLPWASPSTISKDTIENLTKDVWILKRKVFSKLEVDSYFNFPLFSKCSTLINTFENLHQGIKKVEVAIAQKASQISQTVEQDYDLSVEDYESLDVFESDHDVKEARYLIEDEGIFVQSLLSYFFGCAVGRWDIRNLIIEEDLPLSSEPFSALPYCSPGLLQNSTGLPATQRDIPVNYPIPIPWQGILVDDPGIGDHPESFEWDILRGVERVLQVVWPENHESIVAEASQILGVKDLREYFRKPAGFFADHLKRYSKSRRQAPIYWPLSTPSGSYTLWIYYHRLNSETIYTAVNRFISPKLEQVEHYLGKLEDEQTKIFGRSAGELRDKVDSTRAFLVELNEFRTELLRVANLPYQPDLNDGVIINAAPLYKLFRLTKWSKDCQAVWEKLESGEYDWSHMAYVLWPDRVREKCKKDKSLAIAHGLEELYQGEEKEKKGKRKKQAKEEQEGLGF